MTVYKIPRIEEVDSPIVSVREPFTIDRATTLPINRFIPLGYSASGGKYHVMLLFSSIISETFVAHRNKTKYSGYCASYMLSNSDFLVGYLFVVDPNRTHVSDSHMYVGHDTDEEMQNYPLADDEEGVHVYTTNKCVLCVAAEVDDAQFLITDN